MAENGQSTEAGASQTDQPGIGFYCPVEQCKPASIRWLSVDRLTKHLVQVHVRAGQHPPPAFMNAMNARSAKRCIQCDPSAGEALFGVSGLGCARLRMLVGGVLRARLLGGGSALDGGEGGTRGCPGGRPTGRCSFAAGLGLGSFVT